MNHDQDSVDLDALSDPCSPLLRPPGGQELPRPDCGSAMPYRSLVRSPVAHITVFDDSSTTDGEVFRLRDAHTSIGRADCDISLPNDPDISASHAEIVRTMRDGSHAWHLVDTDSTNGTFVRVRRLVLRNGQQLIAGGRHYQFQCQDVIEDSAEHAQENRVETRRQLAPTPAQLTEIIPRLIELTAQQDGREYQVAETGILLGRDPRRCGVCIPDPFLDAAHAEFFQDEKYRWIMRDRASLNGIWVRVTRRLLDPGTEFLLGGQRFRFDPV